MLKSRKGKHIPTWVQAWAFKVERTPWTKWKTHSHVAAGMGIENGKNSITQQLHCDLKAWQ
jgi:hypothetical protein